MRGQTSKELERQQPRSECYNPAEPQLANMEAMRKHLTYRKPRGYKTLASLIVGVHGFEELLETAGLKNFSSCLDWSSSSPFPAYVQHFLLTAEIVKKSSHTEIVYRPPHGQLQFRTPLIITLEKLAQALNLSLEGACGPSCSDDIQAETWFRLGKGRRYFLSNSGKSKAVYALGKFANRVVFLWKDGNTIGKCNAAVLGAAVVGKPVAWGKVLWRNLLGRISSFHQLAPGPGNPIDGTLSEELSEISFGAVIVALLSRIDHGAQHDAWLQNLRRFSWFQAQPVAAPSWWECGDDETLADWLSKCRKKKKPKLIEAEFGNAAVRDYFKSHVGCLDSTSVAEDRDELKKLKGLVEHRANGAEAFQELLRKEGRLMEPEIRGDTERDSLEFLPGSSNTRFVAEEGVDGGELEGFNALVESQAKRGEVFEEANKPQNKQTASENLNEKDDREFDIKSINCESDVPELSTTCKSLDSPTTCCLQEEESNITTLEGQKATSLDVNLERDSSVGMNQPPHLSGVATEPSSETISDQNEFQGHKRSLPGLEGEASSMKLRGADYIHNN
ncbi:hypothetical protein R1sor_016659 [Riccia sorocarpa]|uniref:Uncharacterized protein n=1 Tax=Riccia sorocarpa TaxID=122646 RepID=A0ABD3HJS7_9MARC